MRARHLALVATLELVSGISLAQTPVQQRPDTSEANRQSAASPPASAGTADPKKPVPLTPPRLLQDSQANYPPLALQRRVEARVVLSLLVNAHGVVETAKPAEVQLRGQSPQDTGSESQSLKDSFFASAREAAKRLRFEPALEGGKAIAVEISYTFSFKLPKAAPKAEARPAPRRINFRGQLLERGTRRPLAGLTATVSRITKGKRRAFEAVSDAEGAFVFYNLDPGTWMVRIEPAGYYPFNTKERIAANQRVDAKYYVEKRSYNPYDVLVAAPRPKKEVNRRTLKRADIVKVPGTLGDPVLVLENLPGVARPTFGSGDIIVRGSGPQDTGIYVEGIEIPLIYHFGGLKSVLPSEIVDSIDFYPGNFSVEYGRALGGVFDAHLKKLKPNGFHGTVDISLLDASVYLETPIGETAAIAIAGRRSYIDAVLEAVIPDDSDIAITSAPVYYDYQLLANWRPTNAHDLRFALIGSDDKLKLLFEDPADEFGTGPTSGRASFGTSFQRLITEYRYAPATRFKNRMKLALGRDNINLDFLGIGRLNINSQTVQLRDTASLKINQYLTLNAGIDALLSIADVDVRLPPVVQEGEAGPDFEPEEFKAVRLKNQVAFSGAPFVEGEISWGRWRFVPGLRVDYFSRAREVTFDPRLVVRYQQETWALKGGVAIVHQETGPENTAEDFGNPDLEVQRGVQYSVGGEWKPYEFLSLESTLFYKDLRKLVASTNALIERDGELVPQVLDNSRKGRIYGVEFFIRHKLANNLRGWISYTLSRAERIDRGDVTRLFDYDQTHIFAIVASYLLPRNWEVGLRWRIVSGNPYTPATGGVFVDDKDEYLAIAGAINSRRLGTFHQLDLRVDKSWIFKQWKLSAYLSLVNTYNRQNPEAISYNFDYSQQTTTNGLPILPILGVTGRF